MFEFSFIRKYKHPAVKKSWLSPFEFVTITGSGPEMWFKWDLTKNKWYAYKIGNIIPGMITY